MEAEPKIPNVIDVIRKKARSGDFIILPHAVERKAERDVSVVDIVHVLLNGRHEKAKDEFKAEYQTWNYAIRGFTVDRRDLRIAVSFDENSMLIITVIKLERKK